MHLSKKTVLFTSLFVLTLWGVVLSTFANPPTSPYGASQNIIDPACPPQGTNCYVASVSVGDTIGNNPDQNGILYTDASGQITTDPLFTRDAVTKNTTIGKNFSISTPQFNITTAPALIIGGISGPVNPGDSIIGSTSGATATVEYYYNGALILSSVSGVFQDNETITDTSTSTTATVEAVYATSSFSVGDTFQIFNAANLSLHGTAVITAIQGDVYTITLRPGSDINPGDLFLDQLGGPTKLVGVLQITPTTSTTYTSSGAVIVGDALGSYVKGVSNYYSSDTGDRFATNFVGTALGGIGDTYSTGSLVGDSSRNTFAFMFQDLYGAYGSPSISLNTVDAVNNGNTNLLLNSSRVVVQANQTISLLARVQVGAYDYAHDASDIKTFPVSPGYYYLPQARGTAGQVMTDDGSGNLYWSSPGTSLIGSTSTLGGETWLGSNAGLQGSTAQTVFIGLNAGRDALNATRGIFIGEDAGYQGTNAAYSIFIGQSAGTGASSAAYSNFLGGNAGYESLNAFESNFFGVDAGREASNASNSNFFGSNAGYQAANAQDSNFLSRFAGYLASDANNANFFGRNAGYYATSADNANFLGQNAGYYATDASNANFFGQGAGSGATDAHDSNFLGTGAGSSATNASYSNFIGVSAGQSATNAYNSNFIGYNAGSGATNSFTANFLGTSAGYAATDAPYSVFIGDNTGYGATRAYQSFFIGPSAGRDAVDANRSVFMGSEAGRDAVNAEFSIFFGGAAGQNATDATQSIFMGYGTGFGAANASNSIFQGQYTGHDALNASNSIFIGWGAGYLDTVDNTGNVDDYSILIGKSTSTGDDGFGVGFSNSIALGAYATNTASNQFMIGSSVRPIDEIRVVQSGGTECIIDTSGLGCTSDERLKTNITDLSTNTLNTLLNVKTVTYNWLNNPDGKTMTGFLAQDLEQYFPELVATNERGQKSVYYAQMTPILVEALRELNMKVTNIVNPSDPSSIVEKIVAKLIKADRVETKELCVDDVCVSRDQFLRMVESSGQAPSVTPPTDSNPTPTPNTLTCTLPQILNQAGDACIDPVIDIPPAETPPTEEPPIPTE